MWREHSLVLPEAMVKNCCVLETGPAHSEVDTSAFHAY